MTSRPNTPADSESGEDTAWETIYDLLAELSGKKQDYKDPALIKATDLLITMIKNSYKAGLNDGRSEI
jgi:hypothetical protein